MSSRTLPPASVSGSVERAGLAEEDPDLDLDVAAVGLDRWRERARGRVERVPARDRRAEALLLEPREELLGVLEVVVRVVVPPEVDVDVERAVGGEPRDVEEPVGRRLSRAISNVSCSFLSAATAVGFQSSTTAPCDTTRGWSRAARARRWSGARSRGRTPACRRRCGSAASTCRFLPPAASLLEREVERRACRRARGSRDLRSAPAFAMPPNPPKLAFSSSCSLSTRYCVRNQAIAICLNPTIRLASRRRSSGVRVANAASRTIVVLPSTRYSCALSEK